MYSGLGVINNFDGIYDFDFVVVGVGIYMLIYSFYDVNGCSFLVFDDVEVLVVLVVFFIVLVDICLNDGV